MKKQGFTLIELLVVIAIIGILATIVLASLNSARAKANDTAVKANLNNIRAQAELVYDSATPNSYATVCADPNVAKGFAAAKAVGGGAGTCSSVAAAWAASAQLKSVTTFWCVDSTGSSMARVTDSGAATAC